MPATAEIPTVIAAQIIMGGCLSIQLQPWKRVALTRAAALGPALIVATWTMSDEVTPPYAHPLCSHPSIHAYLSTPSLPIP